MRQDRPRIVLTIAELLVVLALLTYGVGAAGFAIFGPTFFVWLLVLAVIASPFYVYAARKQQRRLARERAARRRARIAARAEPWRDWEKAA